MKKLFLYLAPLLSAFTVMIAVNEYSRQSVGGSRKHTESLLKINSAMSIPDACTWYCHNDTLYCKQHHMEWLKPYTAQVDPLYFGVINLLGMMGNYLLANIIILAVLWPLLMSYLFIKSIWLQKQIRLLKQNT